MNITYKISFGDIIRRMITSFHNDAMESIWHGEFTKKLPNQIQAVARRKLRMVANARTLDDLRSLPNNRLKR